MTSVAPGIDGPASSPAVHVLRVSEQAAATRAPGALAPLSEEERERAAAFVRPVDRDRYLVAHLALRRELGVLLDLDPAQVRLARADCPVCEGPHGRPIVPGNPVHFSLSHAGDVVLLAFAAVPVGVDIEEFPTAGTARETMTALHPREQAELAAVADTAALPLVFARCWTRKEAYLKGTGTGLGEDPSITYVSALEDPAPVPGWRLSDLPAPSGYAAASALRQLTAHEVG